MRAQSTVNHDFPTIVRLLAITLIVASHFKVIRYGGGGSELLMLMVGFNIATFKIKQVLELDSAKPILGMVIKVLIPTVGYLFLLHWYYDSFKLNSLLLISNFSAERHPLGFAYWFIEVYVQLLLLVFFVLLFPSVRQFFRDNPRKAAILFVVISMVIYILVHSVWDTNYLYRRVPHAMLWMFAFGFAARVITDWKGKLLLSVLFSITTYIYFGSIINLFFIISMLLIWDFKITLPKSMRKYIYMVSLSSLFIYLTHFQVRAIVQKVIPEQPVIYLISALIVGAIINICYSRIYKNISGKLKFMREQQ